MTKKEETKAVKELIKTKLSTLGWVDVKKTIVTHVYTDIKHAQIVVFSNLCGSEFIGCYEATYDLETKVVDTYSMLSESPRKTSDIIAALFNK